MDWLKRTLLFLGLLAAACEAPEAPVPVSPDECARQVLGLRSWLLELNALPDPGTVHVRPAVRLQVANIPDADRPKAGKPLVEIEPDRLAVNGAVVGLDELDEALEVVAEEVRALGKLRKGGQWPAKLLLAVDRKAPWADVVRVTEAAARAGFRHLVVLFAPYGTAQLPRPTACAIDEDLNTIRAIPDPVRKAPRMARLVKQVCGPCQGLDDVFRSLSVSNPDTRAKVLTRMLPEAVADCGCQVDLGSLKVLLWSMFSRPAPIAARFDIAPEAHPDAYTLSQPADRPWREAHLLLVSIARPGFSPRVALKVR
jgi:hypothetical protein